MPILQSIKLVPREVLRHATLWFALSIAATACSSSAEDAAAAGALAEQQLQSGDLASARTSINEAITNRDDVVELHLLRGRIEMAAGSLAAAYDAFADAMALDPTNGVALQGVSQLGIRTGHAYESLQATERILSLDPGQPDALLTRGIHALVRRRYDEALTYADKVLAGSPRNENASVLKARALFMQGKVNEALAIVNHAEGGAKPSAAIALTKLEIFRELRDPAGMAEQFAKLRELQPADTGLRLDEANLWFKLGQRSRAHELVVRVLADPGVTRESAASALKLWEEYGTEDLPEASLQAVIRAGSPITRQSLARALLELGRFNQAHEIVSTLPVGEQPSLSARLLAARRSFRPAFEASEQVLAQDETECDALISHSQAAHGLGITSAALESGQRAAAECPEQSAAWLAAVQAYRAVNRTSGVERVFSQALEAHPQSVRVVRSFAEWLLANDRDREAIAIARKLTRDAPALLSGWRYYLGVCQRTASSCSAEAARGLENARTAYGIDLEPGASAPNGLVGRLVRR
jgi:tetratricopeptide (TPR) repeat protein